MRRLVLLAALCAPAVTLASPGELPHSGRLLSAAGDPIEGERQLQFRIYAQASGGSPEWTETDTVQLQGGYYSTMLGDSSSLAGLDWRETSYWLAISPVGGPEFGARTPIGSVPMAFGTTGPLMAPSITTAERDALTPALGQIIFNTTLETMQVYDGSTWAGVGSGYSPGLGESKGVGWGYNVVGGLGMGDNTRRPFPGVLTSLPENLQQISNGGYYGASQGATCAITDTNDLYCTGYESHVPDGSASNVNTFRQVGPGLQWREVTMGQGLVSCGVTQTNQAYCWGYRLYGGIGDGQSSGTYNRAPSLVIGGIPWKSLRPGGRLSGAHRAFLCGVSTTVGAPNGYCWGLDGYGELGNGSSAENYSNPSAGLLPGIEWDQIQPGTLTACGITTDRDMYCWGYNGYGNVGNGNTTTQQRPLLVPGGHKWVDLDLGLDHTCGLREDGVILCWGYNAYGQLGDGTTANRYSPVEVVGGKRWKSVTTGDIHTCALDINDRAYCWGYNAQSGLGDGTTTQRNAPVPIYGEYVFTDLDAGIRETVGITR